MEPRVTLDNFARALRIEFGNGITGGPWEELHPRWQDVWISRAARVIKHANNPTLQPRLPSLLDREDASSQNTDMSIMEI